MAARWRTGEPWFLLRELWQTVPLSLLGHLELNVYYFRRVDWLVVRILLWYLHG